MYDDWTKCTECQFFDQEKYYCKRLLHTVTIGCPYGEPKPATHYDRLISKTPEELAELFSHLCCPYSVGGKVDCNAENKGCKECWLGWLKQEAES